jgi:hypothetical protein
MPEGFFLPLRIFDSRAFFFALALTLTLIFVGGISFSTFAF